MGGRRLKLHPATIPYQIILGRGLQLVSNLVIFGFVLGGLSGTVMAPSTFVVTYLGLSLFLFSLYVVWEILYYNMYSFGFSEDRFEIHSGVVFRREREIPVRRIQNVDINRNLVQRILGLSEVRLESAGGGETEAILKFVDRDTGLQIKHEIKERKREEEEKPEEAAEEVPKVETLFELSGEEFFLLCLCSLEPRIALGIFLVFPSFFVPMMTGQEVSIMMLVLFIMFGVVGLLGTWFMNAAKVFEKFYGFKLSWDGNSLEYERGLLNRRTGSIPIDKIQRVTVRENLLMRMFNFAALDVETAGYAPGRAEEHGAEAAVPLGRKQRVLQLADRLMDIEDVSVQHPPGRARTFYMARYTSILLAITAFLFGLTYVVNPPKPVSIVMDYIWLLPLAFLPGIPLLAYLRWKHLGYNLKKNHFIGREGFWNRSTTIVPYFRTQTLIETQTVFQRFWNLSTFTLDTAGSFGLFGADAEAINVDQKTGEHLLTETYTNFQTALEEEVQKHKTPSSTSTALKLWNVEEQKLPFPELADRKEENQNISEEEEEEKEEN